MILLTPSLIPHHDTPLLTPLTSLKCLKTVLILLTPSLSPHYDTPHSPDLLEVPEGAVDPEGVRRNGREALCKCRLMLEAGQQPQGGGRLRSVAMHARLRLRVLTDDAVPDGGAGAVIQQGRGAHGAILLLAERKNKIDRKPKHKEPMNVYSIEDVGGNDENNQCYEKSRVSPSVCPSDLSVIR